jgi:hypothetical protein
MRSDYSNALRGSTFKGEWLLEQGFVKRLHRFGMGDLCRGHRAGVVAEADGFGSDAAVAVLADRREGVMDRVADKTELFSGIEQGVDRGDKCAGFAVQRLQAGGAGERRCRIAAVPKRVPVALRRAALGLDVGRLDPWLGVPAFDFVGKLPGG